MKICAISDLHGNLPDIPRCDIFIIGGDLCPTHSHELDYQACWLFDKFNPWIKSIDAKYKVAIYGNHDYIGEYVPEIKYKLNCDILTDELREYDGIKIWGSPWTKRFFDWAFNAKPRDLYKLHMSIPKCDIIATHGPPYGFGDLVNRKDYAGRHFLSHSGSPALTRKIIDMQPKLVIGGHIHSGFGTRKLGNTIIANVSHVDERYRPSNLPQVFEL